MLAMQAPSVFGSPSGPISNGPLKPGPLKPSRLAQAIHTFHVLLLGLRFGLFCALALGAKLPHGCQVRTATRRVCRTGTVKRR